VQGQRGDRHRRVDRPRPARIGRQERGGGRAEPLGRRDSRKGFFLQIEGASIDKQDHAANPCGQIGETVAFDAAIRKVLYYQKSHPDTLVVVTADHGHTSQIVETTTMGFTATLITADNANMTVS
jgi:alkaline phosphatase